MITKEEMELIVAEYKRLKPFFCHNKDLLDIYEGDLETHLIVLLKKTLSAQAYENMWDRIAPINILNKIVDKTSTIYNQPPMRKIQSGSEKDAEMLSFYEKEFCVNTQMQAGTELYNLSKSHLIQPYVHEGKPKLRVIPNTNFFVLSLDPVDPLKPTHTITFKEYDIDKVWFYAFTDRDYTVFNQDLQVQSQVMASINNPDGINPYGKIPYIYANQSKFKIMPKPDRDVLTMTKLLPLLMSDLNYAVKFQAFSVMYGINVDDENIKFAPNAFLRFKTEPGSDAKPEIGMIKPQVDIDATLGLIQSQLSLWLNTKGIRPGSVGNLTKDNFANGISKIIDEMDTVEYKRKLSDYYAKIEEDTWNLVMHTMHPYWLANNMLEESMSGFTPDAIVQAIFNLQMPAQSRSDLVKELKEEMSSGFISRRGALKKLNPSLTDEEIDALIADIDSERSVSVDAEFSPGQDNSNSDDNTEEDDIGA